MDSIAAQQIYQQRYETYRHLDRLRWQMFQIAVATGSVVLAFGKGSGSTPDWWVIAAVGVLFASFGIVMERIRCGISKNGDILRAAAEVIGDTGIPVASSGMKNVSFLIAITLIALGVLCLVISIVRFCEMG